MTFIIAECGVNWRDLVDADDMIREAAKAGADAVKFQAYKPEFEDNPYKWDSKIESAVPNPKYHPIWDELNRIALDESTIRYLYWRCQQHGIEFMCTPFYAQAVAMLDPYVMRWKIRHADRNNTDLRKLVLSKGKPSLISRSESGGIFEGEHELFCCPEYPPKDFPHSLSFKGMEGYSCHIPDVEHAAFAVEHFHLKYLEVHVRLDRYEPHYCPIDTAVSITMSELAELCRRLKK